MAAIIPVLLDRDAECLRNDSFSPRSLPTRQWPEWAHTRMRRPAGRTPDPLPTQWRRTYDGETPETADCDQDAISGPRTRKLAGLIVPNKARLSLTALEHTFYFTRNKEKCQLESG
jgi:hypothetical protein